MTEIKFKEDKSTISELRALLGQRCRRRTLRGWISVGTIRAIELRDDAIYVVVNNGVRGVRDVTFPLWQCSLDPASEEDRAATTREDKKAAREDAKEAKEKKKEAEEEKTKKLSFRSELIKRLGGQQENHEA